MTPWEETWVHDTRDERYVVLEPDGPHRTVLMSMDLKRPMNLPAMHARAKLAATAPAATRHLLHLLSEYGQSLPTTFTDAIRATLRAGGVPEGAVPK